MPNFTTTMVPSPVDDANYNWKSTTSIGTSSSSCSSTQRDSSTMSHTTGTDNSTLTSRFSLQQQQGNGRHNNCGPFVLITTDADDDDDDDDIENGTTERGEIYEDNTTDDDVGDTKYNKNNKNNEHNPVTSATTTTTNTRSLNFQWEDAKAIAKMGKNMNLEGTYQLPHGITKSDIMVIVDIDDDVRTTDDDIVWTTNVGMKEQARHDDQRTNNNNNSNRQIPNGPSNNTHSPRRTFEDTVRQCIYDDLQSIYTATQSSAKAVLCIVICAISDGTLDHSIRIGGKVGIAQIALNWRLFGADNLKVYEGGLTVQRTDFGFGSLELTESEGQYVVITSLAPRAADAVMRKIGTLSDDLLLEV